MITTPDAVKEIIKKSPFLEEALYLDLINLSSLARIIRPQIEKKLLKDVKDGAITMALNRLRQELTEKQTGIKPLTKNFGDLIVRSDLVEFTFTNSPSLLAKQEILLQNVDSNLFLTITKGVFNTTIIISSKLEKIVEKTFKGEKLVSKITNLSSISLNLPPETIYTPGVYYTILKMLYWENINIVDVVSSYTEISLIIDKPQIDQAFSILKELV